MVDPCPATKPSLPAQELESFEPPKRARYDRDSLYAVLDDGYVAHVALDTDPDASAGSPTCIPMVYVRHGDVLYLHGSTKSRLMMRLAAGAPVCIAVTHVDGLVLARSAFHHSMNYRSALVYGSGRLIDDEATRSDVFAAFVDRLVPGRSGSVRMPNEQEGKATALIGIDLDEASVKIRTGDPIDDDEDLARDLDGGAWIGVIGFERTLVSPQPAADYRGDTSPPLL